MKKDNSYAQGYATKEFYCGKQISAICDRFIEIFRGSLDNHPNLIGRGCGGGRNAIYFANEVINWALRQIGKRNLSLNDLSLKTGREIQQIDSSSTQWIPVDTIRELSHEAIQKKLIKPK